MQWIRACAVAALPALPLAQGTLVKDLKPGGGFPGSGFWSGQALALGDELLFVGDDGGGHELWLSDGTEAGTHLVHDINPAGDAFPTGLTALGDEVVFVAKGPQGFGVWKTDGTSAGTIELHSTGTTSDSFQSLTAFAGEVWFVRYGATPGAELWKTDGTPAGTVAVASMPLAPYELVPLGDALFIAFGYPGALGYHELWKTDGTGPGTVLLATFTHPSAQLSDFTVLGDALFFTALDFATGRELWRSDGTPAGTALFADLTPGTASTNPDHLQVLDDGRLLFADFVGLFGPSRRLWATDGTVAGTQVIFSDPVLEVIGVASVGKQAYFFASSEVWMTDGTPAGTHFLDGPLVYGAPEPLHLGSGDELVFRAGSYFSSVTDQELWYADGEHADELVHLMPGTAGSSCGIFRRAGARLFFAADDGTHGTELHALPLVQTGAWVGEPFGTGCGAGATPPALSLAGEATVGSALQVDLSGAAPSAAALLFWSPERTMSDVGGGCTVYLAAPQVLLPHTTSAAGAFSLPVAIPDAPVLVGLALAFQELIAVAGGPLLGAGELSGALEVVLGP